MRPFEDYKDLSDWLLKLMKDGEIEAPFTIQCNMGEVRAYTVVNIFPWMAKRVFSEELVAVGKG